MYCTRHRDPRPCFSKSRHGDPAGDSARRTPPSAEGNRADDIANSLRVVAAVKGEKILRDASLRRKVRGRAGRTHAEYIDGVHGLAGRQQIANQGDPGRQRLVALSIDQ
jgi:hypothetical protein